MSRCFSEKFQKNMQKLPDAVDERGNGTYLWENGEYERENIGKAVFMWMTEENGWQFYRKRG